MLIPRLVIFAILSIPLIAFSQDDLPQGSRTVIQDTGVRFNDSLTQAALRIFESVANEQILNDGILEKYPRLRYYITPIFLFNMDEDLVSFVIDDEVSYELPIQFYHPGLYTQAVERLNEGALKGTYRVNRSHVAALPHQLITWTVTNVPDVTIDPWGSLNEDVDLAESDYVTVRVPLERRELFERLLGSNAGVRIEATLHYNALGLLRETISWNTQDIRETQAFKDLESSGANFVSADQIESIVREIAVRKNVYAYQDPGIESTLSNRIQDIFSGFMERAQEVVVNSREEAERIDEQLRAGTGFSAEEFKPIVLMWDMLEEIKEVEGHQEANEKIEEFSRRRSSEWNASLEVIDKALTGTGIREIFGQIGFGSNRQRTSSRAFSDQSSYEQFRSRHIQGDGPDARILEMGITLLEKGDFLHNLHIAASYVLVQPIARAEKIMFPARASVPESRNFVTSMEDIVARLVGLDSKVGNNSSLISRLEDKLDREYDRLSGEFDRESNRLSREISNRVSECRVCIRKYNSSSTRGCIPPISGNDQNCRGDEHYCSDWVGVGGGAMTQVYVDHGDRGRSESTGLQCR